jgi:integrase
VPRERLRHNGVTVRPRPHAQRSAAEALRRRSGVFRITARLRVVPPNHARAPGPAPTPHAGRARQRVGLEWLTIHDLRHTGSTLAAQSGATLADLMLRRGHSTPAAAQRHLHTVDGRDREIAEALSRLASHGDAAALPTVLR